ncbi:MAG: late competence development ComFB family protein [Spirochaetia bacterium]
MKLKNYQEDVVLRAIDIALEDQPQFVSDAVFVNDVAAYVLNRVPARYVMSERGFLRLAVEQLEEGNGNRSLANIIELMILVNQAIEIVRSRRPAPASVASGERDPVGPEEPNEFVHNYPQFFGRVVDVVTDEPVYGAVVTLHMDGDQVPPAEPGWSNPYRTHQQTKAYFSFWPHPAKSEHEVAICQILFTAEHPDYKSLARTESITTRGAFERTTAIYGEEVVNIGTLCLQPREQG